MGNIHNKNSPDKNVPTPEVVELTPTEVEIIKETWKIPCENVSFKSSLKNKNKFKKILLYFAEL